MSERLRHLQRQHSILREHLEWIEGEIARETKDTQPALPSPPSPTIPSPRAPDLSPAGAASAKTVVAPREADEIIEKYGAAERQKPEDIRRGCLIVFFAGIALLAAGLAAVWLLFYR